MAIGDFISVTLPVKLVNRVDKIYKKDNNSYNSRTKIIEMGVSLLEKKIKKGGLKWTEELKDDNI